MNNLEFQADYARYAAASKLLSASGSSTIAPHEEAADETGSDTRSASRPRRRPWKLLLVAEKEHPAEAFSFSSGWEFSSSSPGVFDELDELRTPEGRILRQILFFRSSSSLGYREALAQRLSFLAEAMREEGEEWAEEASDSLRTLLLFLQAHPDLRQPLVTLTPSTMFRAEWTEGPTQHFAVEFLADGQVRFVVFSPDPRHADRTQRVSGVASWDTVLNTVSPLGIQQWVENAWP